MRYTSTRTNSLSHSFESAICSGYAPDGGLFVPSHLPEITLESHLLPWSKLSFPRLTIAILRLFISRDELSDDELSNLCLASLEGFDTDDIVTVKRVGDVFVSELFHGPTFCFKDLGMKFVINVLGHFSNKNDRPTVLVVSTTGDTGPAAVRAVSDAKNPLLSVLVHFPLGQISRFQRMQLTTVDSPHVRVVAFEGGGDDMDLPIKRLLKGSKNGDALICGVNSYNIGRPLMQMGHYVWTYFRVLDQLGLVPGENDTRVTIVLPTGAMGNIAGGYMAKKMGVPLGMLCAGVNINDITHRAMEKGQFHKSQAMERTLSEAINIQVPYNFERLLYYLTDQNSILVRQWMNAMERTDKLTLDDTWLFKLQREFRSARVTDDEMCAAIRTYKEKFSYLCDPHTAVAFSAAEKLGYSHNLKPSEGATPEDPVAVLATASPVKFQESVTIAIGEDGWEEYERTYFPHAAKVLLGESELPYEVYRWEEGKDLEEVQVEWEKKALSIIQKFGT